MLLSFLSRVGDARSRRLLVGLALLAGLTVPSGAPQAQAPLRYVDSETKIQAVSFRFVDHQTFDESRLRGQIATAALGTLSRLRNYVAFLPLVQRRRAYFDPVTLQKDVVRLRRFYKQNGFPEPSIDYPATQLDTARNRIHVVFTIREGPSLAVRNTEFLNADGSAALASTLPNEIQSAWTRYREDQLQIDGRYTDFARAQLADQVQSWFRNRGYAFAQVAASASVDTTQYAVDLRVQVDPGPQGIVSDVQVDGIKAVDKSIILRELPFSVGDRFSAEEVTTGQQKLFDLNLFRVALADVPEQPRDSTVVVRYQVREAKLRAFSGQVGYNTQTGATLKGGWRHRNFYGNARFFSVDFTADTGYPTNPPSFLPGVLSRSSSQEVSRQFRASVTLRQPYLFSRRLSGSIAPFAQERLNPAFSPNPDRTLGLNERQYGVNSTLVFEVLPYRTLSFQHSFARTRQFLSTSQQNSDPSAPPSSLEEDLFNKSVFTLNGTIGDADDFINPTRGLLVRPTVQVGGFLFESGIEFLRLSTELSGYYPVSQSLELAGRLSVGGLWPFEESRTNLVLPPTPTGRDRQQNRIYQNRFSDYLFYAGGGSDVRGWASQLAGGKVLRTSPVLQQGYVYRPIGARSKLAASLEARFPLPGLGENWRTGVFVDGAYVASGALNLTPPVSVPAIVRGPDGTPVRTDPSQMLIGTGAGLRYKTSFGFLRVDLAYKLTPDALDLRGAQEVGRAVEESPPRPPSTVQPQFLRRFRLHFGIGRSF